MASNINPFNIDGTFPVAGQDNDSQGFRDNFTNIRNNLTTAATEITDLQNKAILKSPLLGTTLSNDMGGSIMSAVQLQGVSYYEYDQGTITGSVTLDFKNGGNLQKVTTSGSIALTFANWPAAGSSGSIKLWLNVTNASHTLTVPITTPGVTLGLADIAGSNTSTGVITFDAPGNYIFEFFTVDSGSNVFILDCTRNYSTLRDPNFFFDDYINSSLWIGYGTQTPLSTAQALTSATVPDTISAFGSYNSFMAGNLSLANITLGKVDNGAVPGYSITSARGNLTSGSVSPVQSNDYLGFVNAVAFTGNSAGNVFQQVSSINFFATGSNVTYGLGGNIAFFTADDGGQGPNRVVQAVGMENDQSTRVYGNLILGTGGSTSSYVPATSSSKGVPGQIAWDATYWYICTATNTWKRVAWTGTSW